MVPIISVAKCGVKCIVFVLYIFDHGNVLISLRTSDEPRIPNFMDPKAFDTFGEVPMFVDGYPESMNRVNSRALVAP